MALLVSEILLSKNPVKTGEKFKIQVSAREVIEEPKAYRFPFVLGRNKGILSQK